jgi:Icc-related predicted phosphoesterase
MKLRVLSDLHLEFGDLELERSTEDVVLLAGDIGISTDGIIWADRLSRRFDRPVVIIAGNHEFYSPRQGPPHALRSTLDALHDAAAQTAGRVTFLESEIVVIGGVRFVGTTLWTDFALLGEPMLAMRIAEQTMSDYRRIYRNPETLITALGVARTHFAYRKFIADTLAVPFAGPTVVMTHHPPSNQSIAGYYSADHLAPAYASNLDDLVAQSGAALWLHGHIHVSQSYHVGSTRVVCNPRGYEGQGTNLRFDPNLIIEI